MCDLMNFTDLVEGIGGYQLNQLRDEFSSGELVPDVIKQSRFFNQNIFCLKFVESQSSASDEHVTVNQTKDISVLSKWVSTKR